MSWIQQYNYKFKFKTTEAKPTNANNKFELP